MGMERHVVTMDELERRELKGITSKGSHRSQKVINALILLNCDAGKFNDRQSTGEDIAEILQINMRKVDRVKKRFVEEGLAATLCGRLGRRNTYLTKADSEFGASGGAGLRRAAGGPCRGTGLYRSGLPRDGASGSEKNALRPWQRVRCVIPPPGNAGFVALMEKMLDVYQRHDYGYQRCGTCNVFMATEPLADQRMTRVTERRIRTEWVQFLTDIDAHYRQVTRVTLVVDNLNTHQPGARYETYPPAQTKALGSLRVRLHPEARQLAERGRGRTQCHDPPMPEPAHRQHGCPETGGR